MARVLTVPMYDVSNNALINAYSFSSPVTTKPILITDNIGFSTLVCDVTSGTVKIDYKLSDDGINFDTPQVSDGINISAAGGIVAALTTRARIVFTQRMGKFIQFIFTPTGTTVITPVLSYETES